MLGNDKSILITGATGYVGQWVLKAFVDKGYQVHALKADLTDEQALHNELLGKTFNVVVHLAGNHSKDAVELHKVNLEGTQHLLDVMELASVQQFIFMSSIHVYGPAVGLIDETTVPKPVTTYGRSKLAVEELLKLNLENMGAELTIFRASNAYGAPLSIKISKWDLLFNDLCRQACYDGTLTINSVANKLIDLVYLGDVVEVLLNTIEGKVPAGIYNLCSGYAVPLSYVAEQVQQAWKNYSGDFAEIKYLQNIDSVTSQYNYSRQKLDPFVQLLGSGVLMQEALAIFRLLDKDKQNFDS